MKDETPLSNNREFRKFFEELFKEKNDTETIELLKEKLE